MPPTRGHDLKHRLPDNAWDRVEMPPTRGHDLKQLIFWLPFVKMDAPHTGARLETSPSLPLKRDFRMPPTRGHDLKLHKSTLSTCASWDAPHTGARLETLLS